MVYPHRTFRGTTDVAAAVRVLSEHVSRISYGRGIEDIQIRGSLADQVEDLLKDDAWAGFHYRGEEVAGWARGALVVHRSGPWDTAFDGVPHVQEPWSWLEVCVAHEFSGGGCDARDPLPQSLRRHFVEHDLIAWLTPLEVDTLSIWGDTNSPRRSMRKSADQIMITEPITRTLLATPPGDPSLIQWWTKVFDRIGNKYQLGHRSAPTGERQRVAPPPADDEMELRIDISSGRVPPEDLLQSIAIELEGMGAQVDEWFESSDCMCLPLSGADLPRLLDHASTIARSAGYAVAHPPQP